MSTPPFSDADFGRYIQHFGVPKMQNVTLYPDVSNPDVPRNEIEVFNFIDLDGQELIFTSNGFTFPGRGYIPYKEIIIATWPSGMRLKPNYREYIEIRFRDRPPIAFHAGPQAAVSLGLFVGGIASIRKREAKNSPGVNS
jgi:hypothetical protein